LGEENLSLPRPREPIPPCRKSVRKADVPVSKSYVPWTKHPKYILNKAKTRGDYSHIIGENVIAHNVPNVAKSVASEVSEVTQVDTRLQQGIERVTEFMKTSEALKTDKKLLAEQ